MRKILDVNLQRRIRNRKLKEKYFKIFLLFLFFFAVMFIIWKLSLERIVIGDKSDNFPILFSGDTVLDFEKTDSGFCVLTNCQLNFYSRVGDKFKDTDSFAVKTQISSCGDRVLWYEKDSKKFSIHNKKGSLFTGVLKKNILFGKINKRGSFAFVTESENGYCEFLAFNKKREQIFRWSCPDSLIVDFDFNENCNGCVLTTASVECGRITTSLHELNFYSDDELIKKDILNCMPLSVKRVGGVTVLVCDVKVLFLDVNGSILNEVEYSRNLENYVVTDNGYFLAFFSSKSNNSDGLLVSYDKFGNKINEKCDFGEKIRKIKCYGRDVIALTDSFVFHMGLNLKVFGNIYNRCVVDEFIYIKPYLYYVSMNKINRCLLF